MNYLHDFHAGNFADVLKHLLITQILLSFHQKPTPFCYFETHAGSGLYDLSDTNAQKTKEADLGIKKLFDKTEVSDFLKPYLTVIKKLNPEQLHYYPGSPLIAHHFLRTNDEMILIEKQPAVFKKLRSQLNDSRVHCHLRDGYEALKALLPIKQPRGLVVIDPAFEVPDEFDLLEAAILGAIEKFRHGVYLIWYPLKNQNIAHAFQKKLSEKIKNITHIEFFIYNEEVTLGLAGCGITLINLPWSLTQNLEKNLQDLWKLLSIEKQGYCRVV